MTSPFFNKPKFSYNDNHNYWKKLSPRFPLTGVLVGGVANNTAITAQTIRNVTILAESN